MYDLIVRGGTVVDGTGAAAFPADVGVRHGRITAVGNLSASQSAAWLDASGLIVSPGFIDIHGHSDFTLIADPRAHSAVAQGVTTELVGNCGHGCAPIRDLGAARGNIYGYTPGVAVTWQTTAEYLERLACMRPALNVLTLVPNGLLRIAVMGLTERPATPAEQAEIEHLLAEGMEAGAVGFSTGLEYPVERACTPSEITRLCQVVARFGGLYAPHVRNREVRALEALDEAIDTAEAAGVRLHIPHIIPRRGGAPGSDAQALELIDRARLRGVDVTFDMHTRRHGLTHLSAALPPWLLSGGSEGVRKHLRDVKVRAEISRYESLITSFGLGGWEHVYLMRSASRNDLAGKSFTAIAEMTGTQAFDAVLDVLLMEADDLHFPLCLCDSYTEDQLTLAYRHPFGMVGSDATCLCCSGVLQGSVFHGAFTWAAWFFRRFVREERVFSIEEGVRKLSGQPAERLGLVDRGTIRVGSWADLAVFDAERFGERGTLSAPNRLAEGMVHVVVNGVVERADCRFTSERGGLVLRRYRGGAQ